MITIDTVEDLFNIFDYLPDCIICYNKSTNEETHIEILENDCSSYSRIGNWFINNKDLKVDDFHIIREYNELIIKLEVKNNIEKEYYDE